MINEKQSPSKQQENQQLNENDQKLQDEKNRPKQKVQLPLQSKEELHMIKDKVLEDIESVFNDHMKIEISSDENIQAELIQKKHHFKKRLKGFYNHIICTIRDNTEFLAFDSAEKNQKTSLYTAKNLQLEDKNKETLSQFREVINKTDALKEKVLDKFQEKLENELKQIESQNIAKQKQQQIESNPKQINVSQGSQNNQKAQQEQQKENQINIIKVKDDKGQEKEIDLSQCVKLCLDQCTKNISNEIDRVKNMQPQLKEQLNTFHQNTRQQIKKTIELQYAIESIKNTKDQQPFLLPKMPNDLFD
ncbi:hypothetical protein ABPG72_008746 [Tetrahymena utriculariae]